MPTNALSNNRSPSRCTLAAHSHARSRLPRRTDPSAYCGVAQPFLFPPPYFVPLPDPGALGSATGFSYVSSSSLSPCPMPRITPTPARPTSSENTLLNSCLASKTISRPLPIASYHCKFHRGLVLKHLKTSFFCFFSFFFSFLKFIWKSAFFPAFILNSFSFLLFLACDWSL